MENREDRENWLCKDVEPIPLYQDWDDKMAQIYNDNPYMQNADGESSIVTNLPDSMRTQLVYHSFQKKMDVDVYLAKREIDAVCDERKQSKKMDKELEKKIVSYEVFKGACAELFYAQIGAHERHIHVKRLCNARDILSKIMRSHGQKNRRVLHIVWYGNSEGVFLRMGDGRTGMLSKKLCRAMKERGVFFQTSRRCEEEIMDALLAYLLNNAKEVEIPNKAGWNKMLDGRLHFAKRGETTMSEVWENAI